MNLTLYRTLLTPEYTLGRLFVDDVFFCWTWEDTVRPPGVKVYGKTAIPAGRYRVVIDLSHRFGKMMMHVLNVPLFDGIRVHHGGKLGQAVDTDGCIIVGYDRVAEGLRRGPEAMAKLQPLVQGALNRGESVTIQILNEAPSAESAA